ncbi:MAG: AAA family ATPase [Nitriliruptoraceae bacterium]
MRFTQIEAIGVGPLSDQRLDLAPGLNIVHGLNEAGKSSWHAALTIGWLGQRRGRGAQRAQDREYVQRYQPWTGAPLIAAVRVVTDDGRVLRFRHNLSDLADNDVTDGTGRTVTSDWEQDGTADGAKILGLTREVARATFFVDQADIFAVTREAGGLQEHLQRAAAAADRSATTAAAALALLDDFQRDHVGLDRANATKPLRRALDRLDEADQALKAAADAHENHQDLLANRDVAADKVERIESRVTRLRHSIEAARIAEDRRELAELQALDAAISEGRTLEQPAPDESVQEIGPLRHRFAARPAAVDDDGGVAALEAELAALPDIPDGDTAVHATVADALQELRLHQDRLATHDASRPADTPAVSLGGLTPQDLDRYAAAFEASVGSIAAMHGRIADQDISVESPSSEQAQASALPGAPSSVSEGSSSRGGGILGLVLAGVMGMAGGGLILNDLLIPGVAVLTLAAFVGMVALVVRTRRRASGGSDATAAPQRTSPPSEAPWIVQQRQSIAAAIQALDEASIHTREPATLRELAEQARQAGFRQRAIDEWHAERDDLVDQLDAATRLLANALMDRGVDIGDDIVASCTDYEEACRQRYAQAQQASRRDDLVAQLASVRALAADRAERAEERRLAEERVVAKARELGFTNADPEAADRFLAQWKERQESLRERHQTLRVQERELLTRLKGRSLQEFAATVSDKMTEIGDATPIDDVNAARRQLSELQVELNHARIELNRLEGSISNAARALPSVSEAEEERARAARELTTVRELKEVLDITRRHLADADQRVNEDLAPVLREAILAHLPTLTRGRYTDVEVDPRELTVTVRTGGGAYRPAAHLSHGTAEQIYLLLRLALADHLVVRDDKAPLVLDDVTVQFDEHRTVAFLELCRKLADRRQIILFSQEREVLEWAEGHLKPPNHAITRLPDRATQ